ncbi:MAG TPA: FHA domain-containing protein [Kofleriaceae bacterium]|nr:FHA domain-containing protein [Kofleriaceae bacterium]
MRCSKCGHESPAGSSFCLNCGSSLTAGAAGAQAYGQTPGAAQGLPAVAVCAVCRGENPVNMKFCRSCGSALPTNASMPAYAGPIAGRAGSTPAAFGGGPMPGVPSGPVGGFPAGPLAGVPAGPMGGVPAKPMANPSSGPVGPVPAYGPLGGTPWMAAEPEPTVPPSMPPSPGQGALGLLPTSVAPPPARKPSTVACPRCSTQTPVGFAYCQQCGFQLPSAPPPSTEPATNPRPRGPSWVPPAGAAKLDGPIDPHAGTIAQDDPKAVAVLAAGRGAAPRPQTGPAWGTAVLVNRDGSDGQRYPLSGEYVVIGRAGSDIGFDDDRFLARQHARLERGADGVIKVHPLDALNGVFKKTDAPVELADGTTILVGREVLRFERVEPEEVKVHPLVRHGVALFGSPPREPWGRFVQLIPSGGYRDVRHLAGDEVVLGREEGEIVFRDDAFMSRRHAAVTWDGRKAQITDLGSSNGTFVRITGPTALKHGDHVRMGDQLLRIELGR